VRGPLRDAWRLVRLELVIGYVHRRTLLTRRATIAALNARGGLRLHLGSGDRIKPGWVNVDIHPAADLRLDVRRPWPLADGSAVEAYAEHLFEHLAWPGEARHFLAEARRVLAPGGTLRLSVPDLERHVRAYVARDETFRRQFAPFLPPEAVTWGDALNHHFRQFGEHHYAYDAEALGALLRGAGFADVRTVASSPDYEQAPRDFESLVMTARRP
jgi:predicted SAM-dependent methyltransferase